MKVKNILVATCLFLLFYSCSSDQEFYDTNKIDVKEFLLQARDSRFPLTIKEYSNNPVIESKKNKSDIVFKYEYLGHGFKPITLPYVDPTNFTSPIIDMGKIIKNAKVNKELNLKSSRLINTWEPEITTFTDFSAYAKTTNVTKTIKGGFSLSNIPIISSLFGFGAQKKYTEVFNTLNIDTTKSVYGQLELVYRDSLHRIHIGEATKIDLTGYYSSRFKKDLYNTHMVDLLKSYGSFMISSIETGGFMTAFYHGTFISNEDYEYRSKAIYDSIKTTFTIKEITGGIDFTMHKGNSSTSGSVKKFSEINLSYRTFGGDGSISKFTPPTKIEDLSVIDFSDWAKSLKSKETLGISKIGEEGLVPIYDFLYEENFIAQAKRYITTSLSGDKKKLIEPYIYLETLGNIDMRKACLYFVTKYGDYIRLNVSTLPGYPVNDASMQLVFNEIIGKEKNFFPGLKVIAKHYYANSYPQETEKDFEYDIPIFDTKSPDYKYFKCRENDNVYMISRVNKIAFSLAYDHIWNLYGLQKPSIDNLKEITLHELIGYRVFGL